MAITDLHFVYGDLTPVKRGVRFLGGNSDDGIQVDAAAVAIVAGNHTKGTFSAWVMVPDRTSTCTMFGTGDANAVEYSHFTIKSGQVQAFILKAGPTTQLDVETPAGSITPHTWHHVAIVQDANIMKIYIDGELQTLTWSVATDKAQWFDDMNNVDSATIGAADSVAGGALLTQEFKGYMSDVRLWSGTTDACALSQEEVRRVMSGDTTIQTAVLHNHWKLENDLTDDGTGNDDGTAVGDIIFSDANPFASRLTFLETAPLAADNVTMMCHNGTGYAYSILGA